MERHQPFDENQPSCGYHLPYARTNIDVVIATTASLVIAKSAATWLLAGAIMEDETGLMNAKADTMAVAPHFFLKDQL